MRWFGSTGLGDDSTDEVSGEVLRDEAENVRETSESSAELDADEKGEFAKEVCRSGAFSAKTLVVDRSSIGAEIMLRSTWPSCFLMLVARPGERIGGSERLLRLVKFLASSIFGGDRSRSRERYRIWIAAEL